MDDSFMGNDSSSQSCEAHKAMSEGVDDEEIQKELARRTGAGLVVGPEMLAEILSKKRMDLLHSPEVKNFLIQQQAKLSVTIPATNEDKKDSNDRVKVDSQQDGSNTQSSPKR